MRKLNASAQYAQQFAEKNIDNDRGAGTAEQPQQLRQGPKSAYWRPPGPSVATRKPTRRSRFSSRSSIVGGAEPRRIHCEGGLEEKAAYTFLAHPDVADVREQPPPVFYTDASGIRTKHWFDFLVLLKSGTRIAVQIKPAKFEEEWRPIIELIASQMSREFADMADLITEEKLHPDLVENSMLIHAVRRDPPGDHDVEMRRIVDSLHGEVNVRNLVAHSGLEGAGFSAIVRLIDEGVLQTDGGRIGYHTTVSRAADISTGGRS